VITPEEAAEIYWSAQRSYDWHSTVGKRPEQAQMQLMCWEAVVNALRKDFEREMERLREENREMKALIAGMIESDAVR
jgi:hypothetical protein